MWKNIAAVVIALLLLLTLGELAFRLYDVSQGRSFAGDMPQIRPYRIFGVDLYRVDGDRLTIQSRHGESFPFTKDDRTIRIVAFGGSTTANASNYRRDGIHYPLVLQNILQQANPSHNIEVINVGHEGYATTHFLTILAFDALSWKPDIVIISEDFNDLEASYFEIFFPDYSQKYSIEYYTPGLFELLGHRSRLFRFVRSRLLRIDALNRYPVQRAHYGPLPPQLGREVFARNLKSFVTLAQSNGIKVVLGSQALEALSEADFVEDFERKSYNNLVWYPEHDLFLRHHQAFNDIIEQVAGETGALFVNNNRILGGQEEFFEDFIHYSKLGVETVARNYADAILAAGMIEAGPRPQQLVGAPARCDRHPVPSSCLAMRSSASSASSMLTP
jgi:lysophospholipase L1-like esterase